MLIQDVNRAQEAERSLIGSVLLDPSTLILATEFVESDDFYTEINRLIFRSMIELDSEDRPINSATITAKLFGNTSFDSAGGISYLTDLTSALPSSGNIRHYAEIIRSQSVLRRLSKIGESIKQLSGRPIDDVDALVTQISDDILNLSIGSGSDSWASFDDAVKESLKALMSKDDYQNILTGFTDLDKQLSGLRPGSLTIIAARTGVGKTTLGLNIAANAALMQKRAVGYFSLEMKKKELSDRIISAASSVQGNAFRNKSLTSDEWDRVLKAVELYSKANLQIEDTAGIDIDSLKNKAKRMYKKNGIEMIIVDYLQLVTTKSKRVYSREQEVADVSRGLKHIAMELNIPVIAMAQLNRAIELRQEKRPVLADLRESGSIEQDADNVLFIHREGKYKHGGTDDDNIAEIIIAKQRGGAQGTVKLLWEGQFTRFSNLESENGYY